ncbi:DUF3221 domain-containing protein [Chungangia koreensis]|uniref:DUF3221 domain-containing protein n=1 Tax=Chungangia koreensis TaxID=752657 RepID=A0ABV8X8X3_9LACT
MKKLLSSVVVLLLIIIMGFFLFLSSSHKTTGTIIGNYEADGEFKIWVIDDRSSRSEDIKGKSEEELEEGFQLSGTVYTIPNYVPGFIVSDLQVGKKVKIYFSGIVMQSAPSQADAYWVEILD